MPYNCLLNHDIKDTKKTYTILFSFAELEESHLAGKIGSLITVESGHSIGTSLAVLRMFHRLGARSLTLTHNCNTPWWVFPQYSQTWVTLPNSDHLPTTTTFMVSHFEFLLHKWPLNNDYLSSTATILGSRGWSLYTGVTVYVLGIQAFKNFSDPITQIVHYTQKSVRFYAFQGYKRKPCFFWLPWFLWRHCLK